MLVDYVAPKLEKHCRDAGIPVKTGQTALKQDLQKICAWMAGVLFDSIGFSGGAGGAVGAGGTAGAGGAAGAGSSGSAGNAGTADLEFLATERVVMHAAPELITFSGGVADYIYNDTDSDFPHNDIGVLLGREIRKAFSGVWERVRTPVHTIRATVIGAGMYSTELSGSTITYEGVRFPLKNIPIIRLSKREETLPPSEFADILRQRLDWYKDEQGQGVAAISITGEHNISFESLKLYAARLAEGLTPLVNAGLPQIIIVEHDMAKALGQMLLQMHDRRELVCIDSVSTSQGDYIDIGAPLMGGRVLPVVIKTLVFN